MALSRSAIALIGRVRPQIFDILGNPYAVAGPLVRHSHVAAASELNPQPLPPVDAGLQAGLLAGIELLRLAHTATHLRVDFAIDLDDWCPTPPRRPKVPPVPWPPLPWPREEHPEWVEGYLAGLVVAIEAGAPSFEGRRESEALAQVHEAATSGLASL